MTDLYPAPEGFFVTTLAGDLTATASTISLTALPVRITKGYMVIEPSSATKREVIHFTSVGVSSVTAADDPTDATDATGRGCLGSVALGGVTTHDQGVTVIISAVEQYWARVYDAFTAGHSIAGAHTVDSIAEKTSGAGVTVDGLLIKDGGLTAPKFADGGFIADANGNEVLIFGTTASAVNEMKLSNAATGVNPVLQASGETNVGWDVKMKGTGKFRKPTVVGIQVLDAGTDTAVGDGKAFFRVPAELNGMNLTGVAACVYTAGTTNTTDIQIRNVTDSVDILSTKITIDSTETDSSTATAAVIDTTKDDVVTGDKLAIDIDAVSTTAAKGLYVELRFELP